MFNFECTVYKKSKLVTINFAEYIKNKKVLICPNIKVIQKPSLNYFRYVEQLLECPGLDEIIIIDSKGDNFIHPVVESFFPKITTISTNDRSYITALAQVNTKKQDLSFLMQHWTFQHLVNYGKEMGFWQQPTENPWAELLKNKQAIRTIINEIGEHHSKLVANKSVYGELLSKLYQSTNQNFWYVENYNKMASEFDKEGEVLIYNMGHKLWYFNLFNNKELEKAIT